MAADSNTQTKVVSLRLEPSLAERVERAAAADQRTVGNAVRLLILRGLSEYEREVMGSSREECAHKAEVAS